MNLHQCEVYAQDNGFDSVRFEASFPTGKRNCQWLDAYMGMFQIDGVEGFLMVREIDRMLPNLSCRILDEATGAAA